MQRVPMLNWFRSLVFGNDIDSVLRITKIVRINGIRFRIKKIDVLDFLEGSKVMIQNHDVFRIKERNQEEKETSLKKIREHMKQVLCAGVEFPKLSMNDDHYNVDKLFVNPRLVNKLYEEVMNFTYGDFQKKKIS